MKNSQKSDGTPIQVRNEGQRQLVELGVYPTEIAAKCGCARSTADRWRRGQSVPRWDAREALDAAFRIPLGAWDRELAEGTTATPATSPAPQLPELPPAPPPDAPTLELARHALMRIRRDLANPELSWPERSRLIGDEVRAIEQVMKLEREQEMENPQSLTDHPELTRFFRRAYGALVPFPEAMAAVEKRLESAHPDLLVRWKEAAASWSADPPPT